MDGEGDKNRLLGNKTIEVLSADGRSRRLGLYAVLCDINETESSGTHHVAAGMRIIWQGGLTCRLSV